MQMEHGYATHQQPAHHHSILHSSIARSDSPAPIELSKPVTSSDATMADLAKSTTSSIFVEHLEDVTPSQEDMEAFDCFSPGSYISSRRQSVDLAKYDSILTTSSSLGYDEGESIPSKTSKVNARPYGHTRVYPSQSNNAEKPFAALVRRLSYTSSRLPARYSNSRHLKDGNTGYASKRPKTSSGPLGIPPTSSAFSAFAGSAGDDQNESETPVKVIQEGGKNSSLSAIQGPLSFVAPQDQRVTQAHPTSSTPSRPHARRRSKSGEALIGTSSGSIKHSPNPGGMKGKHNSKGQHHKRPGHPLRSISFMDELLLRTPGSHKRNSSKSQLRNVDSNDHSPVVSGRSPLAVKDGIVSEQTSTTTSRLDEQQASNISVTPMTPDHEIEAALARHDYKRMSMPNLPTPPPSLQQQQPSWAPVEEARRMSVDVIGRRDSSPFSVGLRTPSPAIADSSNEATRLKRPNSSSISSSPGWPWNRRNSNSSLTSLLLSPRLAAAGGGSGQKQAPSSSRTSSPAVSPSMVGQAGNPTQQGSDSGFLKLDRMPSPNLPLRASPLSQQSSPAPSTASPGMMDTPRSTSKTASGRPGVPKRSLSTSFIMLGRKVASFGNSQAFLVASSPRSGGQDSLSSSVSSGPSGSPSLLRRDSGIGSREATSPLKSSTGKKEWPWRHHRANTPASPLSASTASSPHQEEVQWSFKVHGAYPAAAVVAPPLAGGSETSLSPSSAASSPTVHTRKLSVSNAHSPVYARSPLGIEDGDTYFAQKDTTDSPTRPSLGSPQAAEPCSPSMASATRAEATEQPDGNFLSPDRANHVSPAGRSFIVDSRPQLYRGSKSDDGGLAARPDMVHNLDVHQHLSTSAPSAGERDATFMAGHGRRSPGRQVSPSPSRNLTKIPEADEHDLQTRRESWLASLRGRPLASKRRMSAADVFGLPSPSRPAVASPSGLPILSSEEPVFERHSVHEDRRNVRDSCVKKEICELDFTKQPVPSSHTSTSNDDGQQGMGSPSRSYRATPDPATPQQEVPALRSRAVSHSSLLSASRPTTPAINPLPTANAVSNNRLFPVATSSPGQTHDVYFQRQPHRHTQCMPTVPQVDLVSLEVTGLGAPESSVMSGAQAKFARVLGAAAAVAASTPTSTPATKFEFRHSVSDEDKGKMRRALSESSEFENAVQEDEDVTDTTTSNAYASPRDGYFPPEPRRTPKLSYATSSSAGSHPSTVEPPVTGVRYRILDTGTPIRTPAGASQLSQHLASHRSSPSAGTSSSISNPNGPKNAFDILLSNRGLDSIDGLPQSKVHEWARRDGSDDSAITISSNGTTNDGRARDIFDEGRVSVW